ncbi:MAG: Rne/Rng family ribonuclease [Clostridia bacterium]|nr:Rne/Rng family ribonuclease [Clostridia bacterium]
MNKEILVQEADDETKVAVLEDGNLVEIYVERDLNERLVGNIYKGVIRNVLPGMQAAFVDIGLEKNAFLYAGDALVNVLCQRGNSFLNNQENDQLNISDIVKEGQEILVQIAKEPVGTKGARVTTKITLPGRYVVLMPNVDYIGISRRIQGDIERERLKEIAEQSKPKEMGIIVRTVAENVLENDIKEDIENLQKMWIRIMQRVKNTSGSVLVYKDVELVQRILRDLFSEDVKKLSVNSRNTMEKVIDYLDVTNSDLKSKVFLNDNTNLFEKHFVDQELAKALKRKVWLKSGGYVIIDETEALTAIDVNTGKFVGKNNLEETVVFTNCEAAKEIARQLRLRNIGGIIIIDFIDMMEGEHRDKVLAVLEEELRKDKIKANILGITSLGLVEMTRKKVRQSLSNTLERICPYCEGKGRVVSEQTVYISLKKQLEKVAARTAADTIVIEASPQVVALIIGVGGSEQSKLETKIGKKITIIEKEKNHIWEYDIKPKNEGKNEKTGTGTLILNENMV